MSPSRLTSEGLSRRYQDIMSRLVEGSMDSVGHAERELTILKLDADVAGMAFIPPGRDALLQHLARSSRAPEAADGPDPDDEISSESSEEGSESEW